MKILFVYTNINGFHADSFGDGIAMIMAVSKRAGHDIRQLQIFEKQKHFYLKNQITLFYGIYSLLQYNHQSDFYVTKVIDMLYLVSV